MYQIDRVLVTIAGQQDEHISMTHRYGAAHVQAQSGAAWVTCQDINAVTAHAYAWATAESEAAGHLPPLLESAHPQPLRTLASLILRHKGWVQPSVVRSIDEQDRPYLEVAVGALWTRAYDLAAVTSTAQTWARALVTAQSIWAPGPNRVDPAAVNALMGRRGAPPIARPPRP